MKKTFVFYPLNKRELKKKIAKQSFKRRMTFVGVINEESNTIAIGSSVCNPLDQFNKKLGRSIAQSCAELTPVETINIPLEWKGIHKLFREKCQELYIKSFEKKHSAE